MTQMPGLDAFLQGRTEAASFDHAAHIDIARMLLDRYEFLQAVHLYMQGLAAITRKADVPEKLSLTKTLAFLSLIADGQTPDRDALKAFYSSDRLSDPKSRTIFLMPDRICTEPDAAG